jgi:hypothetical protein
MDPAICFEAEEARLSERTAQAKQHVSDGLRIIAQQREVVEELERSGRAAATAKLALVSLVAAQRRTEDYYKHLLEQLELHAE